MQTVFLIRFELQLVVSIWGQHQNIFVCFVQTYMWYVHSENLHLFSAKQTSLQSCSGDTFKFGNREGAHEGCVHFSLTQGNLAIFFFLKAHSHGRDTIGALLETKSCL